LDGTFRVYHFGSAVLETMFHQVMIVLGRREVHCSQPTEIVSPQKLDKFARATSGTVLQT
jgi:hypothetical protein